MSFKNPRINDLNMSVMEVMVKMSGGNPGAARVCVDLMESHGKIDPGSLMDGLGALLMLDTLDIYDHRIWQFYKDVCKEDIGVMCAVMRAYQLGQLEGCTEKAINHAIDNRGQGLDLNKVVGAVQRKLPKFNVNGWKLEECVPPFAKE